MRSVVFCPTPRERQRLNSAIAVRITQRPKSLPRFADSTTPMNDSGSNSPQVGMPPPDQCFDGDDRPGPQVDLGQVVQHQRVVVDVAAQVQLDVVAEQALQ